MKATGYGATNSYQFKQEMTRIQIREKLMENNSVPDPLETSKRRRPSVGPKMHILHICVGWGVIVLLVIGTFTLDKPYSTITHYLWLPWIVLCVAYLGSVNSDKSSTELFTNLLIAAVVVAALGFALKGSSSGPVGDPYGGDVDEMEGGYDATFSQRSETGVTFFLQVIIGGAIGMGYAKQWKDSIH